MATSTKNLTVESLPSESEKHQPLHKSVQKAMERYFSYVGDTPTTNLYNMILAEVEIPVIKVVLQHVNFKQNKAADILGLNRGTLRKKIKHYQLDHWIKTQRDDK